MSETLAEKETGRIEAFSDGVFAIAITLLVLELHVPKHTEIAAGGLGKTLLEEWPAYAAFLISFFSILIMWFNHHKLFNFIRKVDPPLMYLNGFLLMVICAVPWPTALAAEHWGHSEERMAAQVYCGLMVLLALAYNALWRYATHKGRLLPDNIDMEEVDKITRSYSLGPISYLLAFIATFWNATVGMLICVALAIFFAFTGCIDAKPVLKKMRRR
ncbi:MAG: DUF1211 domain-containing protein [Calditrichaeota bacterium]|nr:DUF1211 domain-containing protein [Calditrichota bacterium]